MQQTTRADAGQGGRAMSASAAPLSWIDQLFALRDQLLAAPLFQRWAAAFPLTRRTSARHARAVFDLCAGFVYSQILLAAVRVRLLDVLAERPMTLEDLAPRLGLTVDATARLVRGAQSIGLLSERRGRRYGLGMYGAALRGNPGALVMVEHNALLYRDLVDPVALLRGDVRDTELAGYWPYAAKPNAASLSMSDTGAYTDLMGRSQSLIADDVLAAYDFGAHRHLLDIGGGDGSFLMAVAAKHDDLHLSLLDLPTVAARAEARFAAAGLSARAKACPGDFCNTCLPDGVDVVSLVRIALDHDDDTVLKLFTRIRQALPSRGTLVIAEPMRELPGAETVGDAYFNFYLLAMGSGRARSPSELSALLRSAGFSTTRLIATRRPILTGLLVASTNSDS